MTESEQRQFAFGSNSFDGCPCPALAAGYNPDNNAVACEVAERYDEYARTLSCVDEGLLPDHLAQQAWEDAIDYYRDRAAETTENTQYYSDCAELAVEIQAELWW